MWNFLKNCHANPVPPLLAILSVFLIAWTLYGCASPSYWGGVSYGVGSIVGGTR